MKSIGALEHERFLAAISPTVAVGWDARREPEHETVLEEISKLASLSETAVDWERVVASASELLTNKSKDLTIACYFAAAIHERHGVPGLVQGLQLLSGLLRAYGEQLFPARPRARANSLSWLYGRAAQKLDAVEASFEQAAQLDAACAELASAGGTAFGGDAPSLEPLRVCVRRLLLSAKPETPSAVAAQGSDASAPSVVPVQPVATATPQEEVSAQPNGVEAEADVLVAARDEAETLLQPIDGLNPAGVDTSYDELNQSVRAEIEKLTSMAEGRPDWGIVADGAQSLLTRQTKDLNLAAYLAAALYERRGVAGLTIGLLCIDGLVTRYWESAWPVRRVRGRVAAIAWLVDHLTPKLLALSVGPGDKASLERLRSALTSLEASALAAFREHMPPLRPLSDALARLVISASALGVAANDSAPLPNDQGPPGRSLDEKRTAAAPEKAELQSAVKVAIPLPAHVDVPVDASGVTPFLEETAKRLVEVARALGEADRASADAYRLLRTGLWLALECPSANEKGCTRIPAPEARLRDGLDALLAHEQWESALVQSEALVRRFPFWLDPHRATFRALEAMGERFAQAQLAVRNEVRALCARMPRLSELSFSNGTPLAAPATRLWLSSAEGSAASTVTSPQAQLPDALRAGIQRLDPDALSKVDALLRATHSTRESFQLRLDFARTLSDEGRTEAAVLIYLGLERDLDLFRIEEWEPQLAVDTLTSMRRALEAKTSSQTVDSLEARRVRARLARLSPSALL